jgi:SAM-dependent methyltransferase
MRDPPHQPVPDGDAVTERAAGLLARCFASLVGRGVPRDAAQRFTIDTLAALFDARLTRPTPLEPIPAEATLLAEAAACDWPRVRPEIFGDLFERSLHAGERHRTGSHFTSPADILKIVGPTIVAPWSALIDQARTPDELRALHARMCRYRVLDPACGSGNFLRVALRELRRLEARLLQRLPSPPDASVTAAQFFGIDTSPLAVELAILTLQIGGEPVDLAANFKVMDAIVSADGTVPAWEPVDVIIGNPPFLDARKLTVEHGRDYVARLRAAYPDIPGRADYCVYWFRRAHDHAPAFSERDPVAGRIGLVGTNTIRQNNSRAGGLDRIVADRGTIVDAVASQVWSGAAAVHVSIVNWVKGDYRGPRTLHEQVGDRRDSDWRSDVVAVITSALDARPDASSAAAIAAVTRRKRCFEGQQPGHTGFRLDLAARRELAGADARLAEVVFEYINGDALLRGTHRHTPEFIIDFGERSLAQAREHPHVLAHVEREVLPTWRANADRADPDEPEHHRRLQLWWRLKRRRPEMLAAVAALPRYIACVRHTKRPIFEFLHHDIRPDSALTVFAFADDYSFGILQSSVHWQWFAARCSSLGRTFRYTNETVFDSFPWPQTADVADIDRVASCARALRALRARALDEADGLRAVYRDLERSSARHPLRDAHAELDAAVLHAYRFTASDDILARLLELNRRIAAVADAIGPGVPPTHSHPEGLLGDDCVAPYPLQRAP